MKKRYLVIAYAIALCSITACTKTAPVSNTSVEVITESETPEPTTEETLEQTTETPTAEETSPEYNTLTDQEKSDLIDKLSDPTISTEDIESELESLELSKEDTTTLKEYIHNKQEGLIESKEKEREEEERRVAGSKAEQARQESKARKQTQKKETQVSNTQEEQTVPEVIPTQQETQEVLHSNPVESPTQQPIMETETPTVSQVPEIQPSQQSQAQTSKYYNEDGTPNMDEIFRGVLAGDPEAEQISEGVYTGPGSDGNADWN